MGRRILNVVPLPTSLSNVSEPRYLATPLARAMGGPMLWAGPHRSRLGTAFAQYPSKLNVAAFQNCAH